MSRRVVIGKMPDGSTRLRTALAGRDALTDADNASLISFDSNWTDFVKIHAIAAASLSYSTTALQRTIIPFANLGYKPFVEMRQRNGTDVYDNYVYMDLDSRWQKCVSGYDCIVRTNQLEALPYYYNTSNPLQTFFFGLEVYYVIYRIPVPE